MTPPLLFAFVAGLLTVVAPCTLPVVPLVLGAAGRGGSRRPLAIVAGFGSAFVTLTILLASTLAAAGLSTAALRILAAMALGLVGATLMVPALGQRLSSRLAPLGAVGQRLPIARDGLVGGLATGAAIGVVWAPCAAPVMAGAIAVAVTQGPTTDAVAISIAYVIGASIPLLAVATWGQRAIRRLGPAGPRRRLERGFGALMLAASLAVLSGLDTPLEMAVAALVPSTPDVGGTATTQSVGTIANSAATSSRAGHPAGAARGTSLPDLGPAPELTGITAWIGSPPLTMASLRGHVVIVHFWTFACINCQHVQPYVEAWSRRYASDGLIVIGVHTPELSFERDLANVRSAVATDGVTFPVAFDPAFATWNAYHNRYWPALYFVDKAGRIRHTHFGEGDYAGSEQVIRTLLAEAG
jgi:cytochrome c biogenesis protein CcdA/thiol-disulfide isomerase/thioredoxin